MNPIETRNPAASAAADSRKPRFQSILLILLAILCSGLLTSCDFKLDPDKQRLKIKGNEVVAKAEPPTVVAGNVYETTCITCHGPKGEGNRELGSPSIAGLPAWYVKLQLEKFRNGYRGTHPEDIHGQQMRAIALVLNEDHIEEVSEAVADMPKILTVSTDPNPPSPEEIAKSKKVFADSCMACHRFNGTGERVFRSAPLIGLQDWYHAAQLKKYRDGQRGAHEDDLDGPKMARVSAQLDDEEIRAMAAYLVTLAHGDDPREVMDR